MNTHAESLTAIIVKMAGLYEAFRKILIEEQELLVSGKTESLKGCVDRKDKLAEVIACAEEERLAVVMEASSAIGARTKIAKLEEIAAASGEAGKKLMAARAELLEIVGKVKALNTVNEQLLKDSMSYIRTAFDLVTGKENRRNGYSMNGTSQSTIAVKRNLVNMQA
jgi:flagellar biosynthesis/type III secretory pathway chaperone